jgi:hypothetical protein
VVHFLAHSNKKALFETSNLFSLTSDTVKKIDNVRTYSGKLLAFIRGYADMDSIWSLYGGHMESIWSSYGIPCLGILCGADCLVSVTESAPFLRHLYDLSIV